MAEEETRIMPLVGLGAEFGGGEGDTPCVGVGFVGDTQFGSTQFGTAVVTSPESEGKQERDSNPSKQEPALNRDRQESASNFSKQERSLNKRRRDSIQADRLLPPKEETSQRQALCVSPRIVQLRSRLTLAMHSHRTAFVLAGALVGGTVGVFCALPGSGFKPESDARKEHDQSAGVEVAVTVSASTDHPVPAVPVTFESASNHRILGRVLVQEGALRHRLDVSEAVRITAACPQGFSGAPLDRTFSSSVLRSSRRLELSLSCQPEVIAVEVNVAAKGCGEVEVSIDGDVLGRTEDGHLSHTIAREPSDLSQVLVQIQPLTPGCVAASTERRVDLSRESSRLETQFELRRAAPRGSRRGVAPPTAAHRPYKL